MVAAAGNIIVAGDASPDQQQQSRPVLLLSNGPGAVCVSILVAYRMVVSATDGLVCHH